jgi:hypothetical protein
MTEREQIISDFEFAENNSQELKNQAQVLRYVAALNPDIDVNFFVGVAVEVGYNKGSARNRFNESRKIDKES